MPRHNHVARFSLMLALIGLLIAPAARADTPPPAVTLALTGQFGGAVTAVVTDGDLVYAALGPRLIVLNVADPAQPQVIGRTPPLDAAIYSLAIDGHTVYAAANYSEVRVIDVRDPAAPAQVGSMAVDGAPLLDLAAAGGIVYATGNRALWVIDATDPAAPRQVAELPRPGNDACPSVALRGAFAYVACFADGLRILDVADPAAPREVGVYRPAGFQPRDLVAADDRLTVAAGSLSILDLADPVAPQPLGSYASAAPAMRVTVSGPTAYLADDVNTVTALDVSDPAAPAVLGRRRFQQWPVALAADSRGAYLVEGGGLRILRVAADELAQVGEVAVFGRVADVAALTPDRVVLATDGGNAGLGIIDATVPAAPVMTGWFARGWGRPDLDIAGGLAYVAAPDGWTGLNIFDLADPAAPQLLTRFTGSGAWATYHAVEVRGAVAYLVDDEGLYTVDVSAADAPRPVGALPLPMVGDDMLSRDLWVDGARAYVVESSSHWRTGMYGGLWIIDVADPAHPALLGFTDGLADLYAVAGRGNIAYVADDYGLSAVDVSDPAAPARLGSCAAKGARAITLAGRYAYVAGIAGLTVIDISDPAALRRVAFHHVPAGATSVSVMGDRVYVGAQEAGLLILTAQFTAPPPRAWLPLTAAP